MQSFRSWRRLAAQLLFPVLALVAVGACTPKAPPLRGELAPTRLPPGELPPVHQRVIFDWQYRDLDWNLRGDGVARIAPPDSARLDFFMSGMFGGGGHAVLIGDDLNAPSAGPVESLIPPPPLLWATLGRLAVPAAADTVVRVDGDTLRTDIGTDPRWRATFVDGDLRRLELIERGRLEASVTRDGNGGVRYEQTRGRRRLDMRITQTDRTRGFDDAIWR
jgi:hypothetical protein